MRNPIIDNLRAVSLLGVLGIHIGSLALAPDNFPLYCVLEILSRYSVPAFFFISGYGLVAGDKDLLAGGSFRYGAFLKARARAALVPYLAWSFFYMLYFWLVLPPGMISWAPAHVAFLLFWGLACYHLYFMVILLWFYALYPLWRRLLLFIGKHAPVFSLALLLFFQLAFNWWTTHPGIDASAWHPLAKNFFIYRLNYLPLHYLFVFISGGLAALRWQEFLRLLRRHALLVRFAYLASIIYIAGSAYHAFYREGASLLDLANTYHQLSPQGLFYTVSSLLFFCQTLDKICRYRPFGCAGSQSFRIVPDECDASASQKKASGGSLAAGIFVTARSCLALLATYSMLVYFIHPLILDWMQNFYRYFGIVMTVKKVTFSYFLLLGASLLASILLTKIFARSKILRILFAGAKK